MMLKRFIREERKEHEEIKAEFIGQDLPRRILRTYGTGRMYRMKKVREAESMRGSLNSTMGEPLVASNKLAYSGHRELPIAPDAITSGPPAPRETLSDPILGALSDLRGLKTRQLDGLYELCGLGGEFQGDTYNA